jgi:hypothetical protein
VVWSQWQGERHIRAHDQSAIRLSTPNDQVLVLRSNVAAMWVHRRHARMGMGEQVYAWLRCLLGDQGLNIDLAIPRP